MGLRKRAARGEAPPQPLPEGEGLALVQRNVITV